MKHYTKSAEHFARTTAEHTMTIHHDDGLYRHLEFSNNGSSIFRFDLVTWPGHLSIGGDMDGFVFKRMEDMFRFFRNQDVEPQYWSEKLAGSRNSATEYSEDLLSERVAHEFHEARGDYPGISRAWREHLDDYSTQFEHEAREALDSFEYLPSDQSGKPFRFHEPWEWHLQDYTIRFLWSCHAIVSGIAQYDAINAAAKKAVAA